MSGNKVKRIKSHIKAQKEHDSFDKTYSLTDSGNDEEPLKVSNAKIGEQNPKIKTKKVRDIKKHSKQRQLSIVQQAQQDKEISACLKINDEQQNPQKRESPARLRMNDEQLKQLCCEISDNEEAQCVPNGTKAIECFICGLQFIKIYKLRQHMQQHANNEFFDDTTLEQSSIYSTLNPHQRSIEARVVRDFLVDEIKAKRYSQFYGILSEAGIELHISDSETETDSERENCAFEKHLIPRRSYKCDLCKIDFDRRYKALFHQKTIHANCNLYIECNICGCQFIGTELLIHHLKTQCENDEKPISCIERFKQYLVRINIEQFESLAQARKELKIQRLTTAPKTYDCNVCSKTFTRSEHLTRHKAVHLPEDLKFECPVCFRRFNRKDNMRTHMKVHMQEAERDLNSTNQPILCQYCGHCFTSKSNYVVHMRRHTGEKPYKCDVCGKGFPKSTDLNSHKITHSGEKNFVCSICNKAFARNAVLSKHMRMHAGPFHCNLCAQSFLRPNELATHLRTHFNGGRACTCIICNCNFHTQQELKEHFAASGHDNVRAADLEQAKPLSLSTESSLATNAHAITASNKNILSTCTQTTAEPMPPQTTTTVNVLNQDIKCEIPFMQDSDGALQSISTLREESVVPNEFLKENDGAFSSKQLNLYGSWQQ